MISFSIFITWTICEIFLSVNCASSNSSHITALVLARGGSKGIPLKNLVKVGGISLVHRTLKTILDAKGFSSIWVSTDSGLVAREVIEVSPFINIHWRSAESATDSASSIFAVQEFLNYHPEIDIVALIQCTSPFIRTSYLENALAKTLNKDFECVFSVTRSYKLRWALSNNKKAQPINFDPKSRPRRQDLRPEFIENGMFYFATRNLIEKGVFQSENCQLVEIHEPDSLEVDDFLHLKIAEAILRN